MPRTKGAGTKGGNVFEKWYYEKHGTWKDLRAGTAEYKKVQRAYKVEQEMKAKDAARPARSAVGLEPLPRLLPRPPALCKRTQQTLLPGAAPPTVGQKRAFQDTTNKDVNGNRSSSAPVPKKIRKSRRRSELQHCFCRGDDGAPVGAKVIAAEGGRLKYVCGYAQPNGHSFGGGLGNVRCRYFIGWVPVDKYNIEQPRITVPHLPSVS